MPKKPHKQGKKKQIIVVLAIAVVLAVSAIAGVFFGWLQHQNTGSPSDGGSETIIPRDPLLPASQEAKDLSSAGDYDAARKELDKALAAATTDDEKYDLYVSQGVAYMNQEQYDNAISAYKKAEGIKKTSTIYKALGDASSAKGDKNAAISYYKQAIAALDQNEPLYEVDKKDLEKLITDLGGAL